MPEQYSVAIEVNRIAELVGVDSVQIRGALTTLHSEGRVIGYRVMTVGGHHTYAIARDASPR